MGKPGVLRAFGGWIIVAGVLASSGCSGRERRPKPPSWRSDFSTLGSDLLRAPRGQSIPPPSLGVDLVEFPTEIPTAAARAVTSNPFPSRR
jgi:hypothetical protein